MKEDPTVITWNANSFCHSFLDKGNKEQFRVLMAAPERGICLKCLQHLLAVCQVKAGWSAAKAHVEFERLLADAKTVKGSRDGEPTVEVQIDAVRIYRDRVSRKQVGLANSMWGTNENRTKNGCDIAMSGVLVHKYVS